MDPITLGVMGGATLASGLAQYLNGQEARKQTSANLEQIRGIYNKMQVPSFDESGTPVPKFDMRKLTPEDYKVLQQYVPEVADQVKEIAPQVIQQTGDMGTGRSAQLQALQQLRGLGSGQTDPAFEARMQQASRQASADSQSKIDAITQSQERRGLLGSGNQLAAQLQAATGGMDMQAQMGSQAAMESYRNQLQALRDSAQLGGQIRGEDQSMQAQNAGIINAYNQRTAQAGQQYQDYRANLLNQGQLHNQGLAQDLANRNVENANRYAQYNQQNYNQMQQQNYGDLVGQKQALNDLRQRGFGDQMNINSGLSGAFTGMNTNINQSTADTNRAIGGVGSGITNTMMYADSQDRADARAKMMGGGGSPYAGATSDNFGAPQQDNIYNDDPAYKKTQQSMMS